MDPISAGIATGAVTGVAEQLGKEAIRRAKEEQEKRERNQVSVEKRIPGGGSVTVTVEPVEVCGIVPHPRSGLPVKVCARAKVTRGDAQEIPKRIASNLGDMQLKQIDEAEESTS